VSRSEARLVARRLADAGHEVVFAGGAVRDDLLGRTGGDVDIATSARPEQVCALFERTLTVGEAFGVIKVLWNGTTYDVASFRQDLGVGDGRHPGDVAPATLEEDVQRRDFTINGLVEDPFSGEVRDLVGGRADLAAGVLRAIGDPALRFREDGLRLLRGVRFASLLGFSIEPQTHAAMRRCANGLANISGERVRDELQRMLVPETRRRAVELLDETGLLPIILPELSAMHGVEQPPEYHPEGDVWIHTLLTVGGLGSSASFELALGALLHDIGKPPTFTIGPDRIRFNGHVELGADMAGVICDRLRMSKSSSRRVVELVRDHLLFKDVPDMRPARLRRLMNADHFEELLRLYRADCMASHGQLSALPTILDMKRRLAEEALVPPPLLTGKDIIGQGVAPGPRVGELLREATDCQLNGELNDRASALAWLAARAADERSGA
jgi:putative nucleotidyltransferase with HDIG domain